jgi:hypothetical protein
MLRLYLKGSEFKRAEGLRLKIDILTKGEIGSQISAVQQNMVDLSKCKYPHVFGLGLAENTLAREIVRNDEK